MSKGSLRLVFGATLVGSLLVFSACPSQEQAADTAPAPEAAAETPPADTAEPAVDAAAEGEMPATDDGAMTDEGTAATDAPADAPAADPVE